MTVGRGISCCVLLFHWLQLGSGTALLVWGWLGGAMVLGKLPVPGRPTNLDYSKARAYCVCSGCGLGLFGHFSLVCHFSFLSPSLWEMARYRLKYCLKGPLSPNQPATQRRCWDNYQTIYHAVELCSLGHLSTLLNDVRS